MARETFDGGITNIRRTTDKLTPVNHWDHFLARLGIKRSSRRVEPGLYALGDPAQDSPVFVTANYSLSFDALRSALSGIDAYILVLDTRGINVWCAAGKGTFGTDELVNRIERTGLRDLVNHRTLILPQLGASGVAAHEVKKRSGFKVEYGPVRAKDLPEYLKIHNATEEMRRVKYTLKDRLVLIPVELVPVLIPLIIIVFVLKWMGVALAILAGIIVFPILLPGLPTHNFSTKGFILGGLVAIPFALSEILNGSSALFWKGIGKSASHLLILPAITAFIALNYTGSSTFTSRSGVRREIYTYVPIMAWLFGSGIVLAVILRVVSH